MEVYLGLDRIELRACVSVEILVLLVPQGGHGQRLQVQQLGWRRVLLWQKLEAEGERNEGLC